MVKPVKAIRSWLAAEGGVPRKERQARSQLEGHIDQALLERFLARTIDPKQQSTLIEHLNLCDDCREAIAVVLLAEDDPSAAAELQLKLEKRATERREPWQRRAVRWTVISIITISAFALLFLLPKRNDPDSRLGRWIAAQLQVPDSSPSASDSSFGDVFSGFSSKDESESKPVRRRPGTTRVQPGWNTGPAPYVGNVESSPPFIEINMGDASHSDPKSSSNDKGWFALTRSDAVASPPERTPVQPNPTPPPASQPSSAASPSPDASSSGGPPARPRSRRRLIISDDGRLKRTLDGGHTWEVLTLGPNVELRSLALSGTTVWAAGTNGALFRSLDAAEHWQRAILKYRGRQIVADINVIRFTDAQHGEFFTADGQHWITIDGGFRWFLSPLPKAQ